MFCRTRTEVDELTETLNGRGYRAEALHGGMNQEGRDRVMGRLRNGTAELLIATDVAARGLDVDILTHVVNYDVPSAPDAYVHRIGRVGRAGREGVAITLAEPRELRLLQNIERATKRSVPVEQVPSVAELRARQLAATTDAVRAALGADDLDRFDAVLDELTADGRRPRRRPRRPQGRPRGPHVRGRRGRDPGVRARASSARAAARPRRAAPGPRQARRPLPGPGHEDPPVHQPRPARPIRPGDLVGAIANESDLTGKDIGPINVADNFSTVDVPAAAADAVIAAIKQTTIRGKRATIRRDRNQG